MHVSVIIATRNRSSLLADTLRSLQDQRTAQIDWELIVVNNGSSDATASVLKKIWRGLEMVVLQEPVAGKSRALNRGMDAARGSLLLFTDDDVQLSPAWIQQLCNAAAQYKLNSLFCGPITPRFPPEFPDWLRVHQYSDAMFGRFEPDAPEGPLPKSFAPFGANFAIRASNGGTERFRLDLGPSAENGPMFCEDTEFVSRFLEREGRSIFVPSAHVFHRISLKQGELSWMAERAFHLGRTQAFYRHELGLVHTKDRFLQGGEESDPRFLYERASLLNFYCGQLFQFRVMGDAQLEAACRRTCVDLDLASGCHLLSVGALKVCRSISNSDTDNGSFVDSAPD